MKEKQELPSVLCSLSSSSCLLQEVLQTPTLCSLWLRVCPGPVARSNPVMAVRWEWAHNGKRGRVE